MADEVPKEKYEFTCSPDHTVYYADTVTIARQENVCRIRFSLTEVFTGGETIHITSLCEVILPRTTAEWLGQALSNTRKEDSDG